MIPVLKKSNPSSVSSGLRPRAIPVLTVRGEGLVKTIQFKEPRYIGDPLNSVKIFNDCEVDEILVLDITRNLTEPRFDLIKQLCAEAFMPLSYGGGIRSYSHIETLFSLGIEKVSLNTEAFGSEKLISRAARQYGSQSVLACIDYKKNFWGKRESFIAGGDQKLGMTPYEAAKKAEELGAGEIILHSIDHEGLMKGYDIELIQSVAKDVRVPVIAAGGAKDLTDMKKAVLAGASAAAAGSMFVYHGKLKGILINYPKQSELRKVFSGEVLERSV